MLRKIMLFRLNLTLKVEDGNLATAKMQIKNRWKEYCRKWTNGNITPGNLLQVECP